jgi:hypothetical protein
MVVSWLKHPVERVHILLDETRTPSRVYIEVADEMLLHAAVSVLYNTEPTCGLGIVCGVATPQELMRAVFPSWQGAFNGFSPTLAGLSTEHVIFALETSIITETELNALLLLMCAPDSHLSRTALHSVQLLISILDKFPTFVDGHLYLPGLLRDRVFSSWFSSAWPLLELSGLIFSAAVTDAAVQFMVRCVAGEKTSRNIALLSDLVDTAVSCPGMRVFFLCRCAKLIVPCSFYTAAIEATR